MDEKLNQDYLDAFGKLMEDKVRPVTEGTVMWQQGVENRLNSLDSRVADLGGKVDRHFQIVWVGIFTVAIGLAGIMATKFGWL